MNKPTLAQMLEALEGARAVEKLLSEIARAPRLDPDEDNAALNATVSMMFRMFTAITAAPVSSAADLSIKARAMLVMNDACGGGAFEVPTDEATAMLEHLVTQLANLGERRK